MPQHTHGHDEECLMVQGELFLDDLLLQEGDYQTLEEVLKSIRDYPVVVDKDRNPKWSMKFLLVE